uniref:Uncharacterized protein n=1 Tax=viral metagenome TaxID=1070528 RepID=A0A6C0F4G9_9ZZZZ
MNNIQNNIKITAFIIYIMSSPKRHRFAWSHNELERLNREYENHELSVQEIAILHGRSVSSIFSKLKSEGLIKKLEEARGWDDYSNKIQTENCGTDSLSNKRNDKRNDKINDKRNDKINDKENTKVFDKIEDEEFDPYSIGQKMSFMQTQINNIKQIVSGILYESATNNNNNNNKTPKVQHNYLS